MLRRIAVATSLLLAALLVLPRGAAAGSGDLALFSASTGAPPNIMILLDTSTSMLDPPCDGHCGISEDKWRLAKQALQEFVPSINPPDGQGGYVQNARFGLMTFDNPKSSCQKYCYGGFMRVPIQDGNTGALLSWINAYGSGYHHSGTPYAGGLTDVGRYFAGWAGWGLLPKFGTITNSITWYNEPMLSSPIDLECRDSFVIVLGDGGGGRENMERYGGSWSSNWCSTIGDADGDQGNPNDYGNEGWEDNCGKRSDESGEYGSRDWSDDVAYVMHRTDFAPGLPGMQNLTVYAIGFDLDDPGVVERAAINGGGRFFAATTGDELREAFLSATASIFKGLVAFSAPAVPSTRTEGASSFYYSYFKPDQDDPFWPGSLLAYGLNQQGNIVDAQGNVIVSTGTSFIDPNAPPLWEAGALLKSNTHRNLWTTKGGVRKKFNKTNILEADLNLSAAEIPQYPNYNGTGVNIDSTLDLRHAIIDYIHGQDSFDEDRDWHTTDMRDAVLGDIFHSAPALVGHPTLLHETEEGFGPASDSGSFLARYGLRDRVLYVGANDGMLHAFHAGTAGNNPATIRIESDYYDAGTGEELFGYIPGLLLPTIKMIPRNSPRTYYYVDGSPAVADVWLGADHDYSDLKSANEWATVLVTGMREGGEGYLALDVTDPSANGGAHGPYPKLLWEFTHPRLGETWSEPILTRVKLSGPSGLGDQCGRDDGDGDCREQWVAIFGGGYRADANPNHPSYVADPSSETWSDKSKGIFMVSLDTGELIASVTFDAGDTSEDGPGNMRYALPSTPAVLDSDFDGFADLVYIGDLGGQIWRWDLSSVGRSSDSDGGVANWPARVFFRAYPAATWTSGPDRYHSFFFPPSATLLKGDLVLAFGSGEREDLQHIGNAAAPNDNNRFYVVRDEDPTGRTGSGSVLYEDSLTDLTQPTASRDPADSGFFIVAEEGEKFVTDHLIFAGKVITTSYTPVSDAVTDPCNSGAGGTAFLHIFDLVSAEGFFADAAAPAGVSRRIIIGSGLPTTPQLSLSSGGKDRLFVKTSSGAITAMDPPPPSGPPLSVIYWRQVF